MQWNLKRRNHNWIGLLLVSAGTLLTLAAQATAAVIIDYEGLNSPDGSNASSWLTGVNWNALERGEGLSPGSGNTFNSSGWTDEATDYLQWGWSSSPAVDLMDLDLRYDRSNSGPSMIDVQLSVNGGNFVSVFTDDSVSASGEDAFDVDLSSYTGVSSAVFRLFGSGATSAGGTFDLEPLTGVSPARSIVVNGTVASVPEPNSLHLAATAFLGVALVKWVRRRRTLANAR